MNQEPTLKQKQDRILYLHAVTRTVTSMALIEYDVNYLLKMSQSSKFKSLFSKIKNFLNFQKIEILSNIENAQIRNYLQNDLRTEGTQAIGNINFKLMMCDNILEIEDEIIKLIETKGRVPEIYKEHNL